MCDPGVQSLESSCVLRNKFEDYDIVRGDCLRLHPHRKPTNGGAGETVLPTRSAMAPHCTGGGWSQHLTACRYSCLKPSEACMWDRFAPVRKESARPRSRPETVDAFPQVRHPFANYCKRSPLSVAHKETLKSQWFPVMCRMAQG